MAQDLARAHVLGVYRVECTKSLLAAAMEYKYGRIWNPIKKWFLKVAVRQEIESAVLVELLVPPPNSDFDLGEIRQEGSDQAAYDDHYFSDDGTAVISDVCAPKDRPWQRVAFFFHFYDEKKPLLTTFGPVQCPSPASMPERLQKLMPYEPVD